MLRVVAAFCLIAVTLANRCESPKHSATSYSTTDGFFHYQTAFIAEFTLTCANNVKNMPFYAVVGDTVRAVAISEETSKHQVSWTQEHEKSGATTYEIKIFDEDGIAAWRRDPSVKPLFTIEHYHSGLSRKPFFSSETIALLVTVVALYYAIRQKTELTA
ncbi:hypothetical protein WR25_03028 [Diploscapter pachys]|uniref:Translocon-associated protein subunit delta n=1 Tax=Diploscapter pachys TaxID=2018661 RepID=A0A2A2LTS6_9BILA|nr:hypothetical protein WR25_03028 [Diploscapter pachys]